MLKLPFPRKNWASAHGTERCEKYRLYEKKFPKYFVENGNLNNFYKNIRNWNLNNFYLSVFSYNWYFQQRWPLKSIYFPLSLHYNTSKMPIFQAPSSSLGGDRHIVFVTKKSPMCQIMSFSLYCINGTIEGRHID